MLSAFYFFYMIIKKNKKMLAFILKLLYNISGRKWGNVEVAMFIGQYQFNIDEKGRLVIPQEFRKKLGTEVIINKGIENCISLYKMSDWEQLVEKIATLPFNRSENRQFNRYFMSSAFKKELDSQGRINIDNILIDYAGIKKECVIIGAGPVIEIWAKDKWEIIESGRDQLDEISERLAL